MRIAAHEQRPSQVRSHDDPRLRLGILNLTVDTFSFDYEAMTQKLIQVKQKLPFPESETALHEQAGKEDNEKIDYRF